MSGGKARTAPHRPHAKDWKGGTLDAGLKGEGGASESRFAAPMRNNPVLDPESRKGRVYPSARSFLAAGAAIPCRWFSGARLGARHVCWRDDGLGDDGGRGRRGGSGAPRPDGDAAVLRLQHGPIFSALAQDRSAPEKSAAHLPRELVPQRRRRKIPVARLRRQHARPEMDHRPLRRGHGGAAETPVGFIPRPEDFDLTGLDVSRETMRELFSIKPEEWKKELETQTEFFKTLGKDMPPELIAQHDKLAEKFVKEASWLCSGRPDGRRLPVARRIKQQAGRPLVAQAGRMCSGCEPSPRILNTRLAHRIISGGSDESREKRVTVPAD